MAVCPPPKETLTAFITKNSEDIKQNGLILTTNSGQHYKVKKTLNTFSKSLVNGPYFQSASKGKEDHIKLKTKTDDKDFIDTLCNPPIFSNFTRWQDKVSDEELPKIIHGLNSNKTLFTLIEKGNLSEARALISTGVDLTPPNGQMPVLYYPLRYGCYNFVQTLLNNGCDVLAQVSMTKTEIGTKAERGNNKQIFVIYTYLSVSAKESQKSKKIIKLLAKTMLIRATENDDLTVKDDYGNSLVKVMCRFGYFDFVKYLVEANAPLNQQDCIGCTELHTAATHMNALDQIKYLVESGANPCIRNQDGVRPSQLKGVPKDVKAYLVEQEGKMDQKVVNLSKQLQSK